MDATDTKFSDIIAALGSTNETERCDALADLEEVPGPEVIPYVILALQDSSVRVREAAVDQLIGRGGAAVAEATAALLGSEDVPERNAAIEVLEKLGRSAVDALEKHVLSESVDVRKFAIDTIGKLLVHTPGPNTPVLEKLIERLSDEDRNVSGAAAEALGLAKDDMAIPFLLKHVGVANESSWLQCNVIVALAMIASDKSLEAIRGIDRTGLSNEAQTYLEMALKGEVL